MSKEKKEEKQKTWDEIDIEKLLSDAEALVEHSKRIQKIAYQLAFVYWSHDAKRKEAWRLLEEMVKAGLITERERDRIINDVRRWMDKRYSFEYGGY